MRDFSTPPHPGLTAERTHYLARGRLPSCVVYAPGVDYVSEYTDPVYLFSGTLHIPGQH